MKKDYGVWKKKASSFYYWIIFCLIVTFVFIFFTITTSSYYGFTMLYSKTDLVSLLMALILIVCSAEVFFASNFFLRGNAKNIAVRTICGISFWNNIGLICIDTLKLFLFALLPGIFFGILLLPLINFGISSLLSSNFSLSVSVQSIFWMIGILLYVVFWALILNVSFVYQNSPIKMLSIETNQTDIVLIKVGKGIVWNILKNIIHILLFIGPLLYLIYDNYDSSLSKNMITTNLMVGENNSVVINQLLLNIDPNFFICLLLSIHGLMKCLSDFVNPIVTNINKRKINNSCGVIILGLIRRDIRLLRGNLYMLLAVYSILAYCFHFFTDIENSILIYISYLALSIFLLLTIMIRIIDVNMRKNRQYYILDSIGFSRANIKRIVNSEIFILYSLILCFVLFYSYFVCMYFLMRNRTNSIEIILLMIITEIILYIISLYFCHKFTNKIIWRDKKCVKK